MMLTLLQAAPFLGQLPAGIEDQPVAKPVVLMLVLVLLSLAPFFLMMTTSFVKIAVVFSLIRTALGTQQIPPNQIITGLAMILTIYIMMPVGTDIYDRVQTTIRGPDDSTPLLSTASVDVLKNAIDAGKEPLREFLIRNGSPKDKSLFYNLQKQLRAKQDASVGETDFIILIPAFVITELSEAFQIGFVLFLPFLVIDMVVSNILLAMGMFMVSPITVSLPFKLLLFVLVDGWTLITKGLVLGYMK